MLFLSKFATFGQHLTLLNTLGVSEQQEQQARQPCLQKRLPYGKVSAIMARAEGVSPPSTPSAFRL